MKFKKIILLLGLTVALTVATACGSKGTDADTNGGQTTDQEATMPDADTPIDEDFGVNPEDGESDAAPAEAAARIYGTIEDISGNDVIVDNQSDISTRGESILTVDPQNTILVDAQTALPLNVSEVEKGSFVAYLGPAMTLSLPPQCTPEVLIVNLPEDGDAPYYAVIVEEPIVGDNSYLTVKATDGATYVIPDNANVKPFRTRNILSVEDIHAGTRCLFWLDEQDEAFRVVVLDAE